MHSSWTVGNDGDSETQGFTAELRARESQVGVCGAIVMKVGFGGRHRKRSVCADRQFSEGIRHRLKAYATTRCGSGAGAGGAWRLVPPAPGLRGSIKVLDDLFLGLFLFLLGRFEAGTGAFRAGRVVVTPPPGVCGGSDGAKGDSQGESRKQSLHDEIHLVSFVARGGKGQHCTGVLWGEKRTGRAGVGGLK